MAPRSRTPAQRPAKAARLDKALSPSFNARAVRLSWPAPPTSRRARGAAANVRLLHIEKRINKAFTALDVWDTTVYPHAQVQWDLE